MNPGNLDRRVKIVRSVPEIDECGAPIFGGAETTILSAWAKFTPISDAERLSHKEQVDLTARFTIRWSRAASAVVASDILEFEGRRFGVFGIKEIGRRQYLEITAGTHED